MAHMTRCENSIGVRGGSELSVVYTGHDAGDIEWQPMCQISSSLKYRSSGFQCHGMNLQTV